MIKTIHQLSHLDRVPFFFLEKLLNLQHIEVLKDLADYIEASFNGRTRVSLMIADPETGNLSCICAPAFDEAYLQGLQNLPVTPEGTGCVASAYKKSVSFIEDISQSFAWQPHLEVARNYQIHASWCHPILNFEGEVIGMFSLFFSEPYSASLEEVSLMEGMVQIARLAIERHRQHQAEQKLIGELATSRNRLKVAIKARGMGVFDWDISQNYLYWDDDLYEIYGLPKARFGANFEDWEKALHPADREAALRDVEAALLGQKEFNTQFRILKDGEERYIRGSASVERSSTGKALRMTGVNWDVTERVRRDHLLEESRTKSVAHAKMASLGRMASGIAHEINNPLAIIIAKANQIESRLVKGSANDPEIFSDLRKIESTVERIAKIIRGLRTFSRNGKTDPFLPTSIHQIIEETLELCRMRFQQYGIQIECEFDKDLEVDCRSSEISQVLLNLLSNAFDAMAASSTERWIRISTRVECEHIEIRVRDAGPGIPKDIAERLMEPFFTTKEVGKGTGLGLSISKGIVEDHRGSLWLNTSCSNTEFVVRLPIDQVLASKASRAQPNISPEHNSQSAPVKIERKTSEMLAQMEK